MHRIGCRGARARHTGARQGPPYPLPFGMIERAMNLPFALPSRPPVTRIRKCDVADLRSPGGPRTQPMRGLRASGQRGLVNPRSDHRPSRLKRPKSTIPGRRVRVPMKPTQRGSVPAVTRVSWATCCSICAIAEEIPNSPKTLSLVPNACGSRRVMVPYAIRPAR